MRRHIANLLRRWGLMPWVHTVRRWLSPLTPATLFHNLRFWLGGNGETLPIPGLRARYLVAASADIEGFLELGRRGAESIRAVLEKNGIEPESLGSILDFGCGCGRVLRYWSNLDGVAVYGTEMNTHLVEECRRCTPFAKIDANRPEPPLAYCDEKFDLVYALSVFTHMHVDLQKGWRDELRRVLKPGGLLLITTHGEPYVQRLNEAEREAFRAGRPIVQGTEFLGENLCIAYHPEPYVRETLAQGFEVLDFIPEGARGNPRQDLYLLRRVG